MNPGNDDEAKLTPAIDATNLDFCIANHGVAKAETRIESAKQSKHDFAAIPAIVDTHAIYAMARKPQSIISAEQFRFSCFCSGYRVNRVFGIAASIVARPSENEYRYSGATRMTAAENPDKLCRAAPDLANPLIAAAIAGASF